MNTLRKGPGRAMTSRPLSRRRIILVETHMQLVRVISKNVGSRVPPCFDLDDLIGAGNFGLFKAARRFRFQPKPDDNRGVPERFKAYARRWIEGACIEVVRRRHWTEATMTHLEDLPAEAKLFADARQHPEILTLASELEREVTRVMDRTLDPKSRRVISILYGREETTIKATSRRLGLSATGTGQLARAALRRLEPQLKKVA
jgi:RNA polymerase sigma factor (sigma-70 family)